MLERALEFSEVIDALTSHPKVTIYRNYALTKSDWAYIAQFFREASTMMAAEKYPTLSYSLRAYFLLLRFVSQLEGKFAVRESPVLLSRVLACKEKLLKFYDKSTYDSEYYYFAMVLDPRFKDSLFRSNETLMTELFSDSWINDCAQSLYDTCNEFYNDANHTSISQPMKELKIEDHDDDDNFSRAWEAQLPAYAFDTPSSSSLSTEIVSYLKEGLQKWHHLRGGASTPIDSLN
ncbi:hypothetical protein FRC12_001527 [Ceratobasidium sp. 428]|nr:hypothetical protein FRC12_001527 [Ceratobasidium sp. 428]